MVWKQDLAKLKQALGTDGTPAPPPPKPKVKPLETKPLQDEDQLFLAAMGVKRSMTAKEPAVQAPEAPQIADEPQPPSEAPQGFDEALKDLRGLKPLAVNPILSPVRPPAPAAAEPPAKTAAAALPPPPAPVAPPVPPSLPPAAVPAAGPVRIQLAAGMAVEVDGSLDLRHHTLRDAEERLKDRLADAVLLSWRTLHLTLGNDPGLHEAVQRLLDQGALPVARYAQAPIPLGGAQAWILYLIHSEA